MKEITQHFMGNPDLFGLFLLLLGASLGLWFPPHKHIWAGFTALIFVFCLYLGKMSIIGFSCILLFGVMIFGYYHWTKKPLYKFFAFTIITILGIGFFGHLIPGFANPVLIPTVKLSNNAFPYKAYLNLDKTLAGLFFLGLGLHIAQSAKEWKKAFLGALLPILLTGATLMSFALVFHYVVWDPKLPGITLIWVLSNFFFVCMAEEAFFRGFLLTELQKLIGGKTAAFWGLLLSSFLFGIFHYKGGVYYVCFATIAGLGYGSAYLLTKRIEAAIITHFGINCLHFFLFTYPMLSR